MRRIYWIWGGCSLLCATLLGLVFFIHSAVEHNLLTDCLARWSVYSLNAAYLLTLLGLVVESPSILNRIKTLDKATLALLALVLFGVFAISTWTVPAINRILFDEHIYENIGQSIAHLGRAALCNDGLYYLGEYNCYAQEYNKEPNGYPFYLSQFFQVLGDNDNIAFFANTIAHVLMVLAVFSIAFSLFHSETAALLSAVMAGVTPMALRWGHSAAVEPTATAFAALTIAATIYASRRLTYSSLLLWAGVAALAVQCRPESLLIGIPKILLWLQPAARKMWNRQELAYGFTLLVILLLPHALHLLIFHNHDWGAAQGGKFSLDYFLPNVKVNGLFFLNNERYPIAFTLLAMAGLGQMAHESRGMAMALASWFLAFWGIFLFFYAGSYSFGADVRFSVLLAPPLAILSGYGLDRLIKRVSAQHRHLLLCLALTVLAVNWYSFLPLIRAVGQEGRDARADVEYIHGVASKLPADSIVLSHQPSVWLMQGQSAAQTSIAVSNPSYVDNALQRFSNGIYFHWGYWCNGAQDVQSNLCRTILDSYAYELIDEKSVFSKKFALYRIYPGKTQPVPSK